MFKDTLFGERTVKKKKKKGVYIVRHLYSLARKYLQYKHWAEQLQNTCKALEESYYPFHAHVLSLVPSKQDIFNGKLMEEEQQLTSCHNCCLLVIAVSGSADEKAN